METLKVRGGTQWLSFEKTSDESVLTFQANGSAAGSRSYIVGDFALIKTSVIFLQFNNVKCGRAAHTNHLIFPALLQWSFVFVPVNLER